MIGIKANKANATLIESEKLTSGRVGLPIYFEFSTEWDGLGVFAIYRAGNVVKKKLLTVSNLRAEDTIPYEVLLAPRVNLTIGLYGTKVNAQTGETEVVIPTIYCGAGDVVELGASVDGASATQTPTASDIDQMLSAAQSAIENIIRNVEVAVGTHTKAQGTPSATALLVGETGGGKRLKLNFDYLVGEQGASGGLPTVSSTDNGKIMKVINGQWALGEDVKLSIVQTENEQGGDTLTIGG